jgi:hypothetical protein
VPVVDALARTRRCRCRCCVPYSPTSLPRCTGSARLYFHFTYHKLILLEFSAPRVAAALFFKHNLITYVYISIYVIFISMLRVNESELQYFKVTDGRVYVTFFSKINSIFRRM